MKEHSYFGYSPWDLRQFGRLARYLAKMLGIQRKSFTDFSAVTWIALKQTFLFFEGIEKYIEFQSWGLSCWPYYVVCVYAGTNFLGIVIVTEALKYLGTFFRFTYESTLLI